MKIYQFLKNTFRTCKKQLALLSGVLLIAGTSCNKYLDIVPDNVAVIDNAFTMRTEAEKYLFTCYSFIPRNGDPAYNIGLLGGDEIWLPRNPRDLSAYAWGTLNISGIATGGQNAAEPKLDAWRGWWQGGGPGDRYGLWKAIRNCNIFLENVSNTAKVRDLRLDERTRWLAEVKFLKAYYHYYLLRMYGPIPLVDQNIDISAPESEVRIKRKPFDECVEYISGLLDEAAPGLPMVISDRTTELGRITRPIALAIKAKLWLLAASPLFNGNPDYTSFKDHEGIALFPATYDATKWDKAAQSTKAAIDAAEEAGHILHQFLGTSFQLSETTLLQLRLRTAMTERWSTEHVWANPNSRAGFDMQARAMPKLAGAEASGQARMQYAAPLKIVEMFYSKNGVPINEDKLLDFSNRYTTRLAVNAERFNIKPGYETARINFDREPRFYAFLSFDGGVYYKYDSPSNSDENTWVVEAKYTQASGATDALGFLNETGYFVKKLVDWNATHTNSNQGINYRDYPWPEIRLPDLYLMYAEALNESQGPVGDVLIYVDKIRNRAGLEGVAASWSKYSNNPSKYTTKDGMREIIHQERGIELSFEGQRFWDLRRWKKAAESINQAITGWSVYQDKTADYYRVRTIYTQNFVSPRDYLWPIRTEDIRINPSLVQNPGW